MGVAPGEVGAEVGGGLAVRQLPRHGLGPGVAAAGSAHVAVEITLHGVLDAGVLGEAILRETGGQAGHHLRIRRASGLRAEHRDRQEAAPACGPLRR
ncbi:MAG: hypothetical protein ACK587_04090 [Cyanobacteriota bacterium]